MNKPAKYIQIEGVEQTFKTATIRRVPLERNVRQRLNHLKESIIRPECHLGSEHTTQLAPKVWIRGP